MSKREKEILRLVASGLSALEIAQRLVLSTRTVECHKEHIFKKLGIYGDYEYGDGECRMHLFNKIDSFLFEHLLGE